MAKLALGVIENPYVDAPGVTTGDVAEWLENEYHVMETFADMHMDVLEEAVNEFFADKIDAILSGEPFEAVGKIKFLDAPEVAFNAFIDNREMDGMPGVPTKAAQDGINSRLKLKKGAPRPSFQDTGGYEGSMRAWVEE